MQCACASLSSVVCPTLQYFSTLSHKWHDFPTTPLPPKKTPQNVFWFSLQSLSETFLILRRTEQGIVTVWGRFNALDWRKVIPWSSRRFMSPPGCHYIWGELGVWWLVWLSNSRVVNNTQGFLGRWKRVRQTFCKEPCADLWPDGWRNTWLLFCFEYGPNITDC